MPDEGGVVEVLAERLSAGADVLTLKRSPTRRARGSACRVDRVRPIDGVFWLPGLDLEGRSRSSRRRLVARRSMCA